jgi:phage shock protein PspC (stress-responsive transcriptional regulator)
MDKTIIVKLTGHAERYELDEDAHGQLARYLDGAAARLQDDPDRSEILLDLERSIGDRLTAALGTEDRLVTRADIDAVLDEIGAVGTDQDPKVDQPAATRPRGRRLQRIREGQQIAGVCIGLATYAELDVAWVRTFFVLGTLVTAGILGIVYIALAFILPVASIHEARA